MSRSGLAASHIAHALCLSCSGSGAAYSTFACVLSSSDNDQWRLTLPRARNPARTVITSQPTICYSSAHTGRMCNPSQPYPHALSFAGLQHGAFMSIDFVGRFDGSRISDWWVALTHFTTQPSFPLAKSHEIEINVPSISPPSRRCTSTVTPSPQVVSPVVLVSPTSFLPLSKLRSGMII